MKHEELGQAGSYQLTSQFEDDVANDDLYDNSVERLSADCYERRKKMWTKFNRGDWWIAVGLYLILASIAVVVL